MGTVADTARSFGIIPGFWKGFNDLKALQEGLSASLTKGIAVREEMALTPAPRVPTFPSSKSNPEWKDELRTGKMKLGCAINSSSTLVAELAGYQGYDFVLTDTQHSAVDPEKLRCILQATHAAGCKAFVRVQGHLDRNGIQQSFDLGADGVLVPCVRTADDVKLAVSCSKYPTHGPGSEGGTRSVFYNLRPQMPGGVGGLIPYVGTEMGNASTIVAVQIETKEAYENIESICDVPGLDIVFIGPGDLATSMLLVKEKGMPDCWADPRFGEAVGKIVTTAKNKGVIPGIWHNDVKRFGEFGYRFFVHDSELNVMHATLNESLGQARELRKSLGFE